MQERLKNSLKHLRCKKIKKIEQIEGECIKLLIRLTKKVALRIAAKEVKKIIISKSLFEQSSKKVIKALEQIGVKIIVSKKIEEKDIRKIIKTIDKSKNKKKKMEELGISKSTFYYLKKRLSSNS